ncbi:hypothetical protein PTSG_03040 [Salpingoeca rosetta]|uniref:DUF4838 domain-containing protein n=1 Tax=Salpingoeca rosetta (strain ATCC 50818 / BSB-021) TaxID=946362 RepID=F2U431_SALR5|nr:uncharacterized protein PTSG_03040 [Salpingoeca rosetta]EGD82397.1 hypothetical protein PTSG_03040 [Salpingoeca rosetta]|eukprot:XP_004995633.1 hypothetical protein PTSG_03040 [Salpingoeca rosetta]
MLATMLVLLVAVVGVAPLATAAPSVDVCVATTASKVELHAADELATFLQQAIGTAATVNVVKSGACSPQGSDALTTFAVGYDAATACGLNHDLLDGLGLEGSYVDSGTHSKCFAIAGAEGAPRGALYGVYRYLNHGGVHFLSWNDTYVPLWDPKALPTLTNSTFVPELEYRANNEWGVSGHPTWGITQFINQGPYNASRGGSIVYASPPGFVHTSYRLFGDNTTGGGQHPPTDLFKTNNEWFWPHDDPKAYGQLCWSNASLVNYITRQVKAFLRAQPDATIISVSQNDNQNYCKDPAEMAIIKEEGSPIGPLLRAVNVIADAIKEEFPHVAVDTLAYQYTRPAPKITTPKPNVIVRLCSIECNFAKPLTDPSNKAFQTDITNWSAISQRLYIWNYVTNFAAFLAPFPNWRVIGANIRFFLAHGVRGIFEEGAYCGPGGDMDELKDYLIGQLLFNASQSDDAVIDRFLHLYYGAAGPHVATYMQLMENSTAATDYYMHESFDEHAKFLTPCAILDAATAFAQARAATSGVFQRRVDRTKLAAYYIILLRWDEMRAFAAAAKYPWPIEPKKKNAFNEFARVYHLEGITHLSESGHDLKWLEGRVLG